MTFKMVHVNFNVMNIDKSIAFYHEAFGLNEVRRKVNEKFTIAFMQDGITGFELELTMLNSHPQKYELGENESHLAFRVDDFNAAHEKHAKMGIICYENPTMGIYFVEDPDGYWLEVVPTRK